MPWVYHKLFMWAGSKISFYNNGLKFPIELINKIKKNEITILNISVSAFRIIEISCHRVNFQNIRMIMSGGMLP